MSLADSSFDLADACDQLTLAIANLRNAPSWTESPGETVTLNQLTSSLGDEADNLRTAGVAATLENANSALAAVNDAATRAKGAVTRLKRINEAITLAGSVLSLAAAAAIGDIPGIAKSAQAVVSEVVQLENPPKT